MASFLFAAAESGGSPIGGLIVLAGLIWIGYAIYEGMKPKGYNVRHRSQTTITPRK